MSVVQEKTKIMSIISEQTSSMTNEDPIKLKLNIDHYREHPTGSQLTFSVPGKKGTYYFELTDELKNMKEDHVIIKVE